MLTGCRVLLAETDYFVALEMTLSLQQAGAAVLGPVSSEDAALGILLRDDVDLVIFNAELCKERVTLLPAWLAQQEVASMMVNDVELRSSDPLCQGRRQLLHPLRYPRFQKAVAELLER
ncbi:hypothetical protein BKE38_19015 [Pseudoroseomonas deserti]|uniref:Response regulatory domain-containing protein n=1 Tax=Teichococcus deserti TaxID=1817963 RepID=A0A1V2GZS2_9PROT|nr:hypothetical protein [Pseudoroseomonas deserti]ONG50174.1 hypothetical protein BKE38_19015 [Pseudoroseomonas deserti]